MERNLYHNLNYKKKNFVKLSVRAVIKNRWWYEINKCLKDFYDNPFYMTRKVTKKI